MSIIVWILFGIIAGMIAKWVSPGKSPGGLFGTMLVGIFGALLGGFLATQLLGLSDISGFNFYSFVIAVIGSILFLFIYRRFLT